MANQSYFNDHPANKQSNPYASPISPFDDENAYHNGARRYDNPSAATSTSAFTHSDDDTAYSNGYSSKNAYNGPPNMNKPYPNPFADDIPLSENPQHMAGAPLHDPRSQHAFGQPAIAPTSLPPRQSKKRSKLLYRKGKLIPWFCYIVSLIQIGVFIGELVRNQQLTGSPIETKPNFNIMIGPSPNVRINMGARYVLCMTIVPNITDLPDLSYPCPNATSLDRAQNLCSLSELCGFGGLKNPMVPDQWFRFIVPIFLHAGIIHIAFNLLLQLRLGTDMEREIGSIRFALVYFAAGIFGFVLGGNFAPNGIASVGASGSLFGVLALVLLDLLYTWKERESPLKDLFFILIDVVISFVLGLLPGLDNFSHIGGFLMGCVLGLVVLHSPPSLRARIGTSDTPYTPVQNNLRFTKAPIGFFKGRKGAWWAWWLVRAVLLAVVVIVFILLLKNFYNPNRVTCRWCKYLACLPVKNWCDIGGITTSTTSAKRMFMPEL